MIDERFKKGVCVGQTGFANPSVTFLPSYVTRIVAKSRFETLRIGLQTQSRFVF